MGRVMKVVEKQTEVAVNCFLQIFLLTDHVCA